MPIEPTDELLRIAASYAPKIRDAILESYRYFLQAVPERRIISVLENRGLPGLLHLADVLGDSISENVSPILSDAWRSVGRKTSSVLPKGALIGSFSFDTSRVSALSAAEGYRARFVVDIAEKQRQAITRILERSLMEGWTKLRTARGVREVIGLTAKQEFWVDNYRRQLTQLDPAVFERMLRDRRSDKLISRLIDSGQALNSQQIDSLVERYRQRLVKYRAETIARTESLRAMHMGEYEALLAAQEAGALSPLLRRFWQTSADEKVRYYHMSIPNMNVEGRTLEEPFSTPLGPLMYPLDPNGAAANVINCRCRLLYRMPDASGTYQNISVRGRLPGGIDSILGDLSEMA